jgi:hypothetical protein
LFWRNLEVDPELLDGSYHKSQSPLFVMAPHAWLRIGLNKRSRPDLTSSKMPYAPAFIEQSPSSPMVSRAVSAVQAGDGNGDYGLG